jgi:hypothetical protein
MYAGPTLDSRGRRKPGTRAGMLHPAVWSDVVDNGAG